MYIQIYSPFDASFEKFQKGNVGFVISVRLSAWNNSAPAGRILFKFDIWVFSENLSRKFKFQL